jgi:hypothetical protein
MSSKKVVLWHPMYHPVGHTLLAEAGADVVVVDSNDVGEVKQALHGARVLWVRTPERVTADILDAGKDLIAVSSCRVLGYDPYADQRLTRLAKPAGAKRTSTLSSIL